MFQLTAEELDLFEVANCDLKSRTSRAWWPALSSLRFQRAWRHHGRHHLEQSARGVESLIGEKDATPAKRGPAPKLLQQMERIQRLPKAQQRFVMQMIDTVLAQQDR